MPDDLGPMVRRRQLATILRQHREDAGLTVAQVAEHLLCSPTKISRIETAQRNATLRDVRDLCQLYGITDGNAREQLMNLARQSREHAWWQSAELDTALERMIGLESAATTIRDFQLAAIPGLLQTRAYAEAVLKTYIRDDPRKLEESVKIRMRRQDVLNGGAFLDAVVDEAAIRRLVGNSTVMTDQVMHLMNVGESSRVSLRVIPFFAGPHPGITTGFIILEFEHSTMDAFGSSMPSVAYVEGISGGLYFDQPSDVERHIEAFEALQARALSRQETLAFLRQVKY